VELRDYIRLLRNRWIAIVACAAIGLLVAGFYVALSPKSYQAQAKAFVTVDASHTGDSGASIYAASQFVLQQMKSYTQLSDSGQVLAPVIDELRLKQTVSQLATSTSLVNPADTVVLLINARDASASKAAAIANATARSLATTIQNQQSTGTTTSYVHVAVTTQASAPDSPVSPDQKLDLLLGLVLGLAIGLALAVVRERLDRSVHNAEQYLDLTGEQPLAVIPRISDAQNVAYALAGSPGSRASNAFRTVTVGIALANHGALPARVVVTSPHAGEGRSTFASNLAISMAQSGARVCLVDADLLHPGLAAELGIRSHLGLVDVLSGQAQLDEALTSWRGLLTVLPAGSNIDAAGVGLGSTQMKAILDELSTRFDSVVIDTSPMLASTDALILAQVAKARARHSAGAQDGIVVIGRVGRTATSDLTLVRDLARSAGVRVLGTVLVTVPRPPWQRDNAWTDAPAPPTVPALPARTDQAGVTKSGVTKAGVTKSGVTKSGVTKAIDPRPPIGPRTERAIPALVSDGSADGDPDDGGDGGGTAMAAPKESDRVALPAPRGGDRPLAMKRS
jgi:succinoglycan biosynthesis transport protein ExoP